MHERAKHEGLSVAPSALVNVGEDDSVTALRMARHHTRPRVIITGDHAGVTFSDWQDLMARRTVDGTWTFGTLVEPSAVPLSTADVRLAAEFTTVLVRVYGPRGPIAFVTDRPAPAVMVRNQASAPPSVSMKSFSTNDEAAAWLHDQGY